MSWWTRFVSILICAAGLVASGAALAQTQSAPSDKDLVAVLDFAIVGASGAQASAVTDQLRGELLSSGRFRLVDIAQMNKVMEEQARQQEGCTSQDCVVRVGQLLGVRKIVTGRLTKIEDTLWQVSAILLDVETGETLRQETLNVDGPYRTVLTEGIANLTAKLTGVRSAAEGTRQAAPAPRREPLLRTFPTSDWVQSVAFSPDGRSVLSGGNAMVLWDVSTGQVLRRYTAHAYPVSSVVFSADGRTALSGSFDGTLKLWEVSTGRVLRTYSGHSVPVKCVALSPDGRTALSGSFDTSVKLWDIATGRVLRTFSGHSSTVASVAFSPDGNIAVSGAGDHTASLWEISTGRLLWTIRVNSEVVESVVFSPDGRAILAGMSGGFESLWEARTGRDLRKFSGHSDTVSSVAFSPDGKTALSGSWDTTVRLWEVATGRELRSFTGHTAAVRSVAFSPDGRLALSGSQDNTMKLWTLSE